MAGWQPAAEPRLCQENNTLPTHQPRARSPRLDHQPNSPWWLCQSCCRPPLSISFSTGTAGCLTSLPVLPLLTLTLGLSSEALKWLLPTLVSSVTTSCSRQHTSLEYHNQAAMGSRNTHRVTHRPLINELRKIQCCFKHPGCRRQLQSESLFE